MTSKRYKAEYTQGRKDGAEHLRTLQGLWPLAFPESPHLVRPLSTSATHALRQTFGWSTSYATGVLSIWKTRAAYCRAVLAYPNRITMDGLATDERVDDRAKDMARATLERRKAKRTKGNGPSALENGQGFSAATLLPT